MKSLEVASVKLIIIFVSLMNYATLYSWSSRLPTSQPSAPTPPCTPGLSDYCGTPCTYTECILSVIFIRYTFSIRNRRTHCDQTFSSLQSYPRGGCPYLHAEQKVRRRMLEEDDWCSRNHNYCCFKFLGNTVILVSKAYFKYDTNKLKTEYQNLFV